MASQGKKLAFISYRRDDSSAPARGLRDNVETAFGGECVFMDVQEIRIGTLWPSVIQNAIAEASVLIVVIGPGWLRMQDEHGRRRLDKPGDWVHDEIALSLLRSIPIIPVCVSRASAPPAEALPKSIERLASFQHLELRDTHWREDIGALFKQLDAIGFVRVGQRYTFPKLGRDARVPRPLSRQELVAELNELHGWQVLSSPLPGEHPKQRTEIFKAFQFKTFEDAVAFMHSAVPYINKLNHHPRWENVWKTVTIWSTTWDVGHMITYLDIELAKLIEDLYMHFSGKAH